MNKKIIIIFIAILLVVIIGAVVAVIILTKPSEPVEKEVPKFRLELGEVYSNLGLEKNSKSPKMPVLKFNAHITYTDKEFLDTLNKSKVTIVTEFNKYFMNKTREQVAKMERVQEDLREIVIDVCKTDSEMILKVELPTYIVQ